MFLAGKIHASEAVLFAEETPQMWSRRIHVLNRLQDTNLQTENFPFLNQDRVQYLYEHVEGNEARMPFRTVDKIRITKSIVDQEFDCDRLVEYGILKGHMCVHAYSTDVDDVALDLLYDTWGNMTGPLEVYRTKLAPWTKILSYQPLWDIRNYFGEEISLYFAYVSFYAEGTVWLGVLGLISLFIEAFESKQHYDLWLIALAIIFPLFSIIFVESWNEMEKYYSFQWGVDNHTEHEHIRPRYKGKLRISPVDNRLEIQAPASTQVGFTH